MKTVAATLCLCAVMTGAAAQGLINFANNPQTLVSATVNGYTHLIGGEAGTYYFALLTAPSSGGPFTFADLYATNSGVAVGRFSGGNSIAVNGWNPGATMSYEVAGWASSLGSLFDPAWLTTAPNGFFGVSDIGSGIAGGGLQNLPTLQLFGGTGITQGFSLTILIPEPTTMTLAELGVGVLLVFRRHKDDTVGGSSHV